MSLIRGRLHSLTSAGLSSVVLNEEADGDCLQHEEQSLPPGTEATFSTLLNLSLIWHTVQVYSDSDGRIFRELNVHFNFRDYLVIAQPERELVGDTVGHCSRDGQQLQQHRLEAQPLSALCSHQL